MLLVQQSERPRPIRTVYLRGVLQHVLCGACILTRTGRVALPVSRKLRLLDQKKRRGSALCKITGYWLTSRCGGNLQLQQYDGYTLHIEGCGRSPYDRSPLWNGEVADLVNVVAAWGGDVRVPEEHRDDDLLRLRQTVGQ